MRTKYFGCAVFISCISCFLQVYFVKDSEKNEPAWQAPCLSESEFDDDIFPGISPGLVFCSLVVNLLKMTTSAGHLICSGHCDC